jgi:hypothetical protein
MHLQLCLNLLHWHHLVCFGSLKYVSAIKLLSILPGTCWYFNILNRQIQGSFTSCTCFLALGFIHFMSVLSTLDILYPVPKGQTQRHAEPRFSEFILVQPQFQVSMKQFDASVWLLHSAAIIAWVMVFICLWTWVVDARLHSLPWLREPQECPKPWDMISRML